MMKFSSSEKKKEICLSVLSAVENMMKSALECSPGP